jgi:uncharacterized protein (DUF885 family)
MLQDRGKTDQIQKDVQMLTYLLKVEQDALNSQKGIDYYMCQFDARPNNVYFRHFLTKKTKELFGQNYVFDVVMIKDGDFSDIDVSIERTEKYMNESKVHIDSFPSQYYQAKKELDGLLKGKNIIQNHPNIVLTKG